MHLQGGSAAHAAMVRLVLVAGEGDRLRGLREAGPAPAPSDAADVARAAGEVEAAPADETAAGAGRVVAERVRRGGGGHAPVREDVPAPEEGQALLVTPQAVRPGGGGAAARPAGRRGVAATPGSAGAPPKRDIGRGGGGGGDSTGLVGFPKR